MNTKATASTATGACWLFTIAATALALATSSAWSQEPATPATQPAQQSSEQTPRPPATPASKADAAPAPGDAKTSETAPVAGPKPEGTEAAADVEAPRRFIPSQKSTADNSATFPIDI